MTGRCLWCGDDSWHARSYCAKCGHPYGQLLPGLPVQWAKLWADQVFSKIGWQDHKLPHSTHWPGTPVLGAKAVHHDFARRGIPAWMWEVLPNVIPGIFNNPTEPWIFCTYTGEHGHVAKDRPCVVEMPSHPGEGYGMFQPGWVIATRSFFFAFPLWDPDTSPYDVEFTIGMHADLDRLRIERNGPGVRTWQIEVRSSGSNTGGFLFTMYSQGPSQLWNFIQQLAITTHEDMAYRVWAHEVTQQRFDRSQSQWSQYQDTIEAFFRQIVAVEQDMALTQSLLSSYMGR